MTTGTDPDSGTGSAEERARKAVRARRLTDPLGAMGQRRPGARMEREARARRATFAGAIAAFVAAFGLISMAAPPPAPVADAVPAMPANAVIAFEPQQQAFAPDETTAKVRRPRKERPVYARTQSS